MPKSCDTNTPALWAGGNTYGGPQPRVVQATVRINGVLVDIPQGYIIDPCNLPKTILELEGCDQVLTVNTTSISLAPLFECLTVIHGEGTPVDAPLSNQYPLYSDTTTNPPTLWVWVNGVWVDPSNVAGIDCAALVAHCQLVTESNINEVINNFVTGDTLTNLFNHLTDEQIHNIVAALLSKQAGNLIEDRSDGLYYGIVAPPDLADIYVNDGTGTSTITGNDTNPGTIAQPLLTIQAAFNLGVAGLSRNIWLYEGQAHVVDPANPSFARGGYIYIQPYGPLSDALPPVSGDSKFNSAAGKALNTRIVSAAHVIKPDTLGTPFEFAIACCPTQGALLHTRAVGFVTAPKLSGGVASSFMGMIGNREDTGAWIIEYGTVNLVDSSSRLLPNTSNVPFSLQLSFTDVSGTGYLLEGGSRQYTINIGGGNTPSPLTPYFLSLPTATTVYTSINTNMTP